MTATRPGIVRRFFSGAWGVLDASRRVVMNLLFLLLVVALLVAVFGGGAPRLRDKTALVLDLKGPLVEQRAGSVRDDIERQAFGGGAPSTRLRDVLTVLDAAAKDDKIARVVLVLDDLPPPACPRCAR